MIKLDKKYTTYSEALGAIPRETIGTIGEVPLTIPVEVPASIPMAYTRTRLNRGEDIAVMWALELMLGSDGLSSLLEADADETAWATITEIVIGRIRGATVGSADEAGPKASSNGSQTSPKRAASPRRRATPKS
jgi:hypothetical protein